MNQFSSALRIAPSFPFHIPCILGHYTSITIYKFCIFATFADLCHVNDFGKCISLGYLQDIQALRRRDVYLLTNLFHQNSWVDAHIWEGTLVWYIYINFARIYYYFFNRNDFIDKRNEGGKTANTLLPGIVLS